jgi:hypothetical protein
MHMPNQRCAMLCNKTKASRKAIEMVELSGGWSKIPIGPSLYPPFPSPIDSAVCQDFLEAKMTKSKPKASRPDVCLTPEQTPDEVRAILWAIASDPEQSGTSRVGACRLLLMDARERDDGAEGTHQDADLNKRALALMRRMTN